MTSISDIVSKFGHQFKQLEKNRKKSIVLTAIGWSIFMLFILAITFFVVYNLANQGANTSIWLDFITWLNNRLPKGFPPQIVLIGGFILLSTSISYLLRKSITSESTFRLKTNKIIKEIAKKTLPDFSFNKNISVTKDEVKQSKLFSYINTTNQIIVTDTLSKEFEHTEIKICDIELYGSNYTKGKSFLMSLPFFNQLILSLKLLKSISTKRNMNESLKNESFKGVFSVASFNKNLKGHTLILPDNLEKVIGKIAQNIQKFNFRKEDLIKLEDPEFEKEFVVYSTDQVEARYVLTTSMMERLTALKRKINKPIMVSFTDNKINIAILNSHGFFGVDKSKKMNDSLIEDIYLQLTYISGIVDDLKLDFKYLV